MTPWSLCRGSHSAARLAPTVAAATWRARTWPAAWSPSTSDGNEEIGGLLSFGIPPFKLEKQVIATRRAVLEAMGVRFHLGCHVGRDISAQSLFDDFDAVFLGTGATRPVDGGVPGQDLSGVLEALPFLAANARRVLGLRHGNPSPPELAERHVVVLGGGDTAMDCVRTSIRLGAASVTCVYRRDACDMPGSRREVKYAREEGVHFLFGLQPVRISGTQRATAVEFAPGFTLPADIVIVAFGFRASPAPWFTEHRVSLDDRHHVVVDGGLPLQTANPRVFAGGDNVRGADLVVTAVRDGRDAGNAIARFLAAP